MPSAHNHSWRRQSEICATAIGLPLLLCVAGVAHAASPAAPANDTSRRYVTYYEQILAAADPRKSHTPLEQTSLAEAATRLQLRTGRAEYGEAAKRWLDAALANPQLNLKDFHVFHTLSRCVRLMRSQNSLSDAEQKLVGPIAATQLQQFIASTDDADNNIRLAQVVGYANLLQYATETRAAPLELLAKATARVDAYWKKIIATGDLDEDASNYDSLGTASQSVCAKRNSGAKLRLNTLPDSVGCSPVSAISSRPPV